MFSHCVQVYIQSCGIWVQFIVYSATNDNCSSPSYKVHSHIREREKWCLTTKKIDYFDSFVFWLIYSSIIPISKIQFHWLFLIIILGFNNSITSRFPNLMRLFQIQGIFYFMTYTSHGNRSKFLLLLVYSDLFQVYSWIFLEIPYYSLTSLLFLFLLRSTLTYKCRSVALWWSSSQVDNLFMRINHAL